MASDNIFEELRDLAAGEMEKLKEAAYQAYGVGKRPYGHVRLPAGQKRAYWKGLSPEQQQQEYSAFDEKERREFDKEIGADLRPGGMSDGY